MTTPSPPLTNGHEVVVLLPLAAARDDWERLAGHDPAAGLYHHRRWTEVLRRAYGFEFLVALLRSGTEFRAGCLFAEPLVPWSRRLVALPFSDRCPPLALDGDSRDDLLRLLAGGFARPCAIRGASGSRPWCTVDRFINWELDLSPRAAELHARLATNFRRNLVKASRAQLTIEHGSDRDHLARFRALHEASRRRQGVPSQPARFFTNLWELYGPHDDLQVWLASAAGKDLAAVLTLREGDAVYYKWGARAGGDGHGAGHLLAWTIIEALAGQARVLDLGRADRRNEGLNRFKRETGATSYSLPYIFLPRAPGEISPEVPSGFRRFATTLWRRLPPPVSRAIGDRIYRYLN